MEQYIPFLFENKVDGNLFINLTDDEWADMGITNKFHVRKLQIILKAFRSRYLRKKQQNDNNDNDDNDDNDLDSEYSPSELSAMIRVVVVVDDDSIVVVLVVVVIIVNNVL